MVNTRRNRKNTTRKNRKQRGAGFFDFFKSKNTAAPAPAAAAPPPPAPAAAAPNAPANRSFMNRMRTLRNRTGASMSAARNRVKSGYGQAKGAFGNYGRSLKNMRNVMRSKPNMNPNTAFGQSGY